MVKVQKMKNLLDYLTDDKDEALDILAHVFAKVAVPELDSSLLVRSLDQVKAMKLDREKAGGKTEWL